MLPVLGFTFDSLNLKTIPGVFEVNFLFYSGLSGEEGKEGIHPEYIKIEDSMDEESGNP